MNKPWFIDLLTYALVALWMLLTFATMQQYGPNVGLLVAAVVVLAAGLFMIYNQRLAYLRIRNWIVFESGAMHRERERERENEETENREERNRRNR
jgi:hypothetical protein